MLIYCAHRYGGKTENKSEATRKLQKLQLEDPKHTYLSPIHALGHSYSKLDYDTGMELCYDVLRHCDMMLVLSSPSEGVCREIRYAREHGISVRYWTRRIRSYYRQLDPQYTLTERTDTWDEVLEKLRALGGDAV